MENADEVDRFASLIIPNCQPTASQEEKIQSCIFARESEVFPGGTQSSSSTDEASEQATGILMVSLPESSGDYQTPPEHHLSSQNSINDGHVPATKPEALDWEMESGGARYSESMVVEDSYDRKEKRMVDITHDSDNLNFMEKSPKVLENNDAVLEDSDTLIVDENDTEPFEAEHTVEETEAENGAVDALKMLRDSAHKVFVGKPMREQEVSMITTTEVNTIVNKTHNYNDYSHLDLKGKRRLPCSVNVPEKINREEDDFPKDDVFTDTLNRAWKILVVQGKGRTGGDEDDGDFDFLKTAIRRGLTFPRPRWWPPGGTFED